MSQSYPTGGKVKPNIVDKTTFAPSIRGIKPEQLNCPIRTRPNQFRWKKRNKKQVTKLTAFNCAKYGEDWLMKQFNKFEIENFKPLMINKNINGHIEIFLENFEVAKAIKEMSMRTEITELRSKIKVSLHIVDPIWIPLSDEDGKLVNSVVDKRYDHNTKILDLSAFHMDQEFLDKDAHMTLNKNNIMLAVLKRIDEQYGNVTALSLKNNRLRNLDFASMLPYYAKFLTVLDLSENLFDNINVLEKFRTLKLNALYFQGNPACEQYTVASQYLAAIQSIFPQLSNLDSDPVSPLEITTGFEEQAEKKNMILPGKPSFYCNSEQVQSMIEKFVTDYYMIYDESPTRRKGLHCAYTDETSTFTMSIKNLPGSHGMRWESDANFHTLRFASHNIMEEKIWSRYRNSKVFRGAMDIAVQLSKMPGTKHLKETFITDVHLQNESAIAFSIQGLFEEHPHSSPAPPIYFFNRNFVVVPKNVHSVAIISDMLFVSVIPSVRLAKYKRMVEKINKQKYEMDAGTSQMSESSLNDPLASLQLQPGTSNIPNDDIKQQMIQQFITDSTMNAHYSRMCLEEANWDYGKAGECYLNAKAENRIPDEAFVMS